MMVALITVDEIKALRQPFPLDKHIVREGHSEGGKVRWFVYIDRSAVQDRLDEMFPGEWETSEPKMYPVETRKVKDDGSIETSHEMSATMGIIIRGLTRWDGGESDDGSTKSAITNAFRRTAAYGWGIARYLYDMDVRIKTDSYRSKDSNGRWQTDWNKFDQVKQQAMDQFTQWYNRMFNVTALNSQNGARTRQDAPNSSAAQIDDKTDVDPANAATAAKSALAGNGATDQRRLGQQPGYKMGEFKTRCLTEFYNGNTFHMNGSLKKLFDAGKLPPKLTLEEALDVVRNRKEDVETEATG